MTPEALLRERYKVIADYFYSPYKIGDIITVEYEDRSIHLTTTSYRNEFGETVEQANYFNPARLKDFPHLFQPLQLWEERDKADMPKYIKWTNPATGEVQYFEVFQWLSNSAGAYTADVKEAYLFIKDILPATEQQYLEYIKQKEG